MSDHRDLRSYGRRRGRARSRRQQNLWTEVLPRVALTSDREALALVRSVFAEPVREVWLEIGFGGGEHLLWQAEQHVDVGLIGCEPFEDGVAKVLSAIATKARPNVRIWPEDARPLLRVLPGASLSRAFILFPDPWPKKRHHKRRLVTSAVLDDLARVMQPGAELRIGTDIGAYAAAILRAVLGHGGFGWVADGPGDWRQRPEDWPPTRYEAKALAAGRRCYYFRFTRGP